MNIEQHGRRLTIGVIGAGFSGTALAATLHQLSEAPLSIILFDKTNTFGLGDAYKTPFPFHLLNVRARDMSAFEDQPAHFVNWLRAHEYTHAYLDKNANVEEQFVPRFLFGHYLKDLLHQIEIDATKKTSLHFEGSEVIDALDVGEQIALVLKDGKKIKVDRVILALGNHSPPAFPFPVSPEFHCIANPWDYTRPQAIAKQDDVLIVGTGLSMIDTVLTLHYQEHKGKIYALSRHGLVPLPHSNTLASYALNHQQLPLNLRALTKDLRAQSKAHASSGGDWREIINALRIHIPAIWERSSLSDKKQFLRHVMPYWNVHRHRVHQKLADLLLQMMASQQLKIMAGRVIAAEQGKVKIKLRHSRDVSELEVKWLINCLGPSLSLTGDEQILVRSLLHRGMASFDPLKLGLEISSTGALKDASGKVSSVFYTLGSLRKGACWESGAVPELRKQSFDLARHLLGRT